MPRQFTVVDIDKQDISILAGYRGVECLAELVELSDKLASTYGKVVLTLYHMVYLDYEDAPIEDATSEEIEILKKELPSMYDIGVIHTEQEIELELDGWLECNDNEIVDTVNF